MSPTLISSIIGLAIAVLALGGVAPSIYETIASNKVSQGVGREELLAQQVARFQASEGQWPADMAELVAKGYWSASDNDNGFGGAYSFAVDSSKNQLAIGTVIADPVARAKYLSKRRVFAPTEGANGLVTTTVVLPGGGIFGAPVSSAGAILVSSTAPNPSIASYWYDTSGATPVLRVHDGTSWVKTDSGVTSASAGGMAQPSASNIVTGTAALPASATTGDVKYVFDASTSSLQAMYFYNGSWLKAGSGENPPMTLALAAKPLSQGRSLDPYSYDFKTSLTGFFSNTYAPVTIDFANVKWSVSGPLPTGLTLDPATGVLSGTPTTITPAPPSGNALTVVASYRGMLASQQYTLNVASANLRAKSLSAGMSHSCAVTPSDTVKCWGRNSSGQLGNNSTVDSFFPVDVQGLPGPVASVSAGGSTSCALLKSGAIYCWGDNSSGQLGINSTTNSLVAALTVSSGASAVSVGSAHTCGIIAGAAKCWGANPFGGLGNNTTAQSNVPAAVNAPMTSGVAMIFAGGSATCAVTTAGAAYCWGYNNGGSLGDGTVTNRSVPTAVSGISTGATYITLGWKHGCAVVSGGVKCWGTGSSGALGRGSTANSYTPVDVTGMGAGSGVSNVQAFASSTLAYSADGTVKGWGAGSNGIIGTAAATTQTTPVLVSGFAEPVSSISSGSSASTLYPGLCAVASSSGRVYCWGPNGNGQLSQGNTTTVSGPPILALTAAW